MPPVAMALAGGAAIWAGSALGLGFLTYLGASLIIGAAADALMPKPQNAFESSDRSVMVRQAITPHRIVYGQVRVSGPVTFIHTTNNNLVVYVLLTLSCHELEEIGSIFFADEEIPFTYNAGFGYWEVTSGRWAGVTRAWKGLGTTAGDANLLIGLNAFCAPPWTANHAQAGRGKLLVELSYRKDLFPGGLPNISTTVKGRKVYDPREPSHDFDDPTTWEWSTNAALCVGDYLYGVDGFGVATGLGASEAEIDWTSLTAAANLCDEAVPLAAGGTESRYAANGTVTKDESPKDALGRLLTACGGMLVRTGGAWVLHAAGYRTPTAAFDEDDLAGPVKVVSRVSRRNLFNAAKGVFISPEHSWQETDIPPVTSSTYETEDGGSRVFQDFNLPFTTSPTMAQRLLKINLERIRRQITAQLPCKLQALAVRAGDVIQFSLARMGWTTKTFEVADWAFSSSDSDGAPHLFVQVWLRETDSNVYAWTPTEEHELPAAAATTLPDPFTVDPPTALSVSETLYQTSGEIGVKARASLTWTPSGDGWLKEHVIERRAAGVGDYVEYGRTAGDEWTFFDLAPGSYDFRVKAVNTVGVSSTYATALAQSIDGLLDDLDDVTNMRGVYRAGRLVLVWDRVADVREVAYEIRVGGAAWATARTLVRQKETEYQPVIDGTYRVKAVSGAAASADDATATISGITLNANVVETFSEHDDWAGTMTGFRPKEPVYDDTYDGTTGPPAQGWPLTGVDHASSDGDVLTISNAGADQCYYTKAPAGWDADTIGWWHGRVKVGAGATWEAFFNVALANPGPSVTGWVKAGSLYVYLSDGYHTIVVDTTSDFIDVHVVVKAGQCWILVNDILVLTGTPRTSTGGPQVGFGKGQVFDLDVAQYWDLVEYGTGNGEPIVLYGGESLTGTYTAPTGNVVDLGSEQVVTVTATLDATFAGLPSPSTAGVVPVVRLADAGLTWGDWHPITNGEEVGRAFQGGLSGVLDDVGASVEVEAFTWTVDMPDRIDESPDGGEAIDAAGTAIGYATPFQRTPSVQVTVIGGADGDSILVTPSTESGFTVRVFNGGVGVARTVDWIAKGY